MRLLLSFFLTTSLLTIFGQSGKAIVEENRVWSTLDIHCMPNGNNYSTYYIRFDEDTIIDGFNYKRMWHSNDESQLNWILYGFIREDENKRVYLRPPDYYEGMVYDFGCAVGDTLVTWNIYLNNDSLHFVVTNIDSVLLLDGYKKRITLFEFNNELEEVWVEGLGSYYGILNSGNNAYGGVCGSYQALCYENNDALVYQHPDYATCYYDATVSVDQKPVEPIRVYPNPANDFVNIEVNGNEIKEIEIFDLNGKKIFNETTSDNKILINLQRLDKGLYIVKTISNNSSYLPIKLTVD